MGKRFTFKIGGPAGFGVMSAGLTFSKIAVRAGYEVYDYVEYPSLVRGGHNVMQTTVGEKPVLAPDREIDFLVALNQETIDLHGSELAEEAGILCDVGKDLRTDALSKNVRVLGVPLLRLAQEVGGTEIMRNTVALGASVALLGGELRYLKDLIGEEFSDKKSEVTVLNHKAAQAGYDYARKRLGNEVREVLKERGVAQSKMVITGNEAVALGAIAAGMKFAVIYPMTPISNILHTLAPLQEKYGFIYKQPEDEISAINMAIGASFAGARSMVATSGGGFCLMTEGLGLSGMTETPLVMVEGMRGAPATGLPTWTEQGDLRFVLHAHQGEFPRIVLAPGDAREAFFLTMKAFNLADKYQCPVILLLDKYLCENHQSFELFDYGDYKINRGELVKGKVEGYERYKVTENGVSPRSVPGSGNFLLANSDEHNEEGYSAESAENRVDQMKKRMRKLVVCAERDMGEPNLYGPEEAEVTIVSWGSNKGAILEAMGYLGQENGETVNYLHLNWIWPFPTEAVAQRLGKARKVVSVEGNYSGQMAGLIKEKTGMEIKEQLLKCDGRPIFWEEVVEKVESV